MVHFRNSLGRNDNPNAIEFRTPFKRLYVCHPLMTSVDQNTITNATGILTVSSDRKNRTMPSVASNGSGYFHQELDLEIDYECTMLTELEEAEPYEQHMCAYIALCVEEKFIQNTKNHKYKCTECAEALLSETEKINDDLLAMKCGKDGRAQQPSASTLKIIIFCNAVIKMNSQERPTNSFSYLSETILKTIDVDDLFNKFLHFKLSSYDHRVEFIHLLIKTYLNLKAKNLGKKISEEERGRLIRYNNKRNTINAGQ